MQQENYQVQLGRSTGLVCGMCVSGMCGPLPQVQPPSHSRGFSSVDTTSRREKRAPAVRVTYTCRAGAAVEKAVPGVSNPDDDIVLMVGCPRGIHR